MPENTIQITDTDTVSSDSFHEDLVEMYEHYWPFEGYIRCHE